MKLTFNRRMQNILYIHCVQRRLHVSSSRLLDSPRKYIWEHFVNNVYTKANGFKIELVKTHVRGQTADQTSDKFI